MAQYAATGGGPSHSLNYNPYASNSPSMSLRSSCASGVGLGGSGGGETPSDDASTPRAETINLQIFVPDLQIQKCLTVQLDDLIWEIKKRLFEALPQPLAESHNFGLFLPPCDGRAGKFLLEDRPIRDYPFHDCVPYVEVKYKKRVYKMLKLDEKALKQLHSKTNLRKFLDYVRSGNAEKVEKACTQGLDPNFHDLQGETPLSIAAGLPNSRDVLVQLVGGGAHLDFRNTEGQTAMHKAAFCSMADNVKTLLELGASPNYKDPIGLTPLYYNLLSPESSHEVAELLLSEAADIGVHDMHGNEPLHQACKNGLATHVEHLLYYGANINMQNVNGNTPLHVCAVNNKFDHQTKFTVSQLVPECARVLLYRGCDPTIANNQQQTPIQVAHIVNNLAVADVIQCHNPQNSVPHRGTPKYNTRRRHTGNRISRRRSLSHCSMASVQSVGDRYQVPHAARHQQARFHLVARRNATPYGRSVQIGVSPSPSCVTMGALENNYGTLRRYPAECVRISHPGFEENIPRILVIPRGQKGFGFILRGANPAAQDVNFEPTHEFPALQFFEGVDMTGPSMQAGLRPGDFLLAINGVDVRCASHEQVVELIHQSGDTISLKVITVNPQATMNGAQSHYATGYGTMIQRRNSSASVRTEGGGLPPLPPQRHPTTSLSFGRGVAFSNDETDSSTPDYQPLPLPPQSSHQLATYSSSLTSSAPFAPPHQQLINPTMEGMGGAPASGLINHVHNPRLHQQHAQQDYSVRCASVKARPSAARRISAAELEHLMIRQSASGGGGGVSGAGPSQFQPNQIQSSESSPHVSASVNGGPKKLAELKRKKQRGCAPNTAMNGAVPTTGGKPFPLKSFNSSPELLQYPPPQHPHPRQPSTDSNGNYSRPFRPTLRPKTPPPPPPAYPPTANGGGTHQAAGSLNNREHAPPLSAIVGSSVGTSAPPAPPPPPPPPNLLKQPPGSAVVKSASVSAVASSPNAVDCRGISADALQSVRLKPTKTVVKGVDLKATFNTSSTTNASPQRSAEPTAAQKDSSPGGKKPADFDTDLRSALARRRSKVCADEEATSSGNTSSSDDRENKGQLKSRARPPGTAQTSTAATTQPSSTSSPNSRSVGNQPNVGAAQITAATVGRYGGLSLKESVRENVQPVGGAANKSSQSHHSPPSGFVINKKDSGYTSSRTSLEPSECGDDTHQHPQHHRHQSTTLGVKNSSSSSANTLVEEAGTTTIRIPVDDLVMGSTPTAISPPSPSRGHSELLLSAGAQAHRVTLISKQLEDSYGTDRRTVVATGKSGATSAFKVVAVSSEQSRETASRPLFLEDPTRTPAVDYEEVGPVDKADSGHGDSDQDGTASGSIQLDETGNAPSPNGAGRSNVFMAKKLVHWSAVDVAEWLCHLQLHDYVASFSTNQITGKELAGFDRAKFTQLGVTRISHRQTMEQSLQKDYA